MNIRSLLILSVITSVLFPQSSFAGKKDKSNKVNPVVSIEPQKKKDPLENCKKFDGLFTMYQDTLTGKAYLLIREDQLNKEYIYFSYIENGVLDASFHRGEYRGSEIFTIKKYYGRIEFEEQNTAYYFDSTNAISKAADANISPSIAVSEPWIDEYKVKGEYLLNADKIFLTENISQVRPSYGPDSRGFKLGKLSSDKTKYGAIRSYPQNTDVIVDYVYETDNPAYTSPAVTDGRYVTVKMQHSFIEVPKDNFKPRYDDPRVGYFSKEVNDMTSTNATPYRDMIDRWNLEKKDPTAALSEPVKPIVWWIENTTPKAFRETIKKGVLAWNVAFEKAGFKNAIQVYEQPDNATWDAGDIRYNVLRWTSSPTPPFGGYGPSFVNPRTGEILGADIMLEYVLITNRLRDDRVYNHAGMDLIDEEQPSSENHNDDPSSLCSFGSHMVNNNIYAAAVMKMMGADDADQDEYVKAALLDVVMHEVGHTLGLMHNMKSSCMLSPDDINNKQLTQSIGQIGSVMDYNLPNFVLDRAKQGEYFPSRVGPYDEWAIEYGYSQALTDAKAEKERLQKILSRSADPKLSFGNDADDMRSAGHGIDPHVMISDLTSDPITYSIQRIEITRKILPTIKERFSIPGQSYQELRNTYLVLTGAQATALAVISRYIGGVYVDRAFVGEPDSAGSKPYTPVSYYDQKRAVKAIGKYLFAKDAFALENDLYNYLQQQRRGWMEDNEDPKITGRALAMYKNIFSEVLHPTVLQRLTDSELYGNKYSVSEMMNDLTIAIFADDIKEKVNVFRQLSQAEYVNNLVRITENKGGEQYNHQAQAGALYQLKEIQKLLKTAVPVSDIETKAHREDLLFQIDKALNPKS